MPPVLPPGMNRENMIINMGPHHPSTHGVLRLVVELDGETVVNVDPDLGYLHSGFEKTGENKRYKDFVYYTDRMDYLSGMNNNFGYVLTVEKLLGLEIPRTRPGASASSWASCSVWPRTSSGCPPMCSTSPAPA